MGKLKENVCPGCGRHCTAENVRCKYGRSYFEKRNGEARNGTERRRYKWEGFVEQEGLLWKMLMLSARLKKALKSGDRTEAQLMDGLTGGEKELLADAIRKIEETMKKNRSDV